jgi:hypothetical protein
VFTSLPSRKRTNAQEVQVTTFPIVEQLYSLFSSTSVITGDSLAPENWSASNEEEDEVTPIIPADASIDNHYSSMKYNDSLTNFSSCNANITHMMMHNRESTAVGNIIIYHNNNINPSVQFQW